MAESLTLSSIFLLGCFHALEPGHGKTFLMAYTIGERLDLRKSLLLTLGMITSHFTVLSVIAVLFNLYIFDVIDQNFHEFSHWFGPSLITLFGAFILGRSIYKKNHSHSDDCGHEHGKIKNSRIKYHHIKILSEVDRIKKILPLIKTKYTILSSDDDLLLPKALSNCLEEIEKDD